MMKGMTGPTGFIYCVKRITIDNKTLKQWKAK